MIGSLPKYWESLLGNLYSRTTGEKTAQNLFAKNNLGCHVQDSEGIPRRLHLFQKIFLTMKVVFTVFFALLTSISFGQDVTQLRKSQFNLDNGIAINGYDPVAYFKQGKAIKGKKELAVFDQGVTYYFSSNENKDEFKKDPSRYEPQYGGWCAFAMGKDGSKVEVDPGTFKVVDGKLYLYYNKFFNNTLKSWNKDESNLKAKADMNWKKFYH